MFYFQALVYNNKEALEVLLQHGATMEESDINNPNVKETTRTFARREYAKQKVSPKIIINFH